MTTILSYGGGVNSSAIIALARIGELTMPDYIVFSDTGAEYPETYTYIEYLQREHNVPITIIEKPHKEGTLIQYCQNRNFIPSRMYRWCTDHFKIQPLRRFAQTLGGEYQMILGIDAGEEHRAKKFKHHAYPLLELGIDRKQCKEILKKSGFGVPRKSGCFICPYQRKSDFINLRKNHPDLWEIAVELEKNAQIRSEAFTYKGMPIEKFVADLHLQEELPFGVTLDQKCECYFD